jgi:hypothetical protein
MGLMPPYDPFTDTALAWAVVEATSAEPNTATWTKPSRVTFRCLHTLRGDVPAELSVTFSAPREASQQYFYAQRDLVPIAPDDVAAQAELARRTASLDATPVELPELGKPLVIWIEKTNDSYEIPTLRALGGWPFDVHQRFIDGTPKNVGEVCTRLGVPEPTPLLERVLSWWTSRGLF